VGSVGNDGLWELPNKHKILVEVKTTDAFRIPLDVIAAYRKELVRDGTISEDASSVLIIVGRADTGGHEAQIRGSRHAWDMRLISVTALLRLMRLKESVDDPDTLRQIYQILIPREFTKLDEIVELVFSTAEDAKKSEEAPETEEAIANPDKQGKTGPKFTPVAFNDLVAARVSEFLAMPLLKRTRALFSSPDDHVRVVCKVSRQHEGKAQQNYWFAFHKHQKELLDGAEKGFAAFGCGSAEHAFLIPINVFDGWLDKMNMTVNEDRSYWHVQIYEDDGKPVLVRKKGVPRIDLVPYLLSKSPIPKSGGKQ
jgi:hypothetical protein